MTRYFDIFGKAPPLAAKPAVIHAVGATHTSNVVHHHHGSPYLPIRYILSHGGDRTSGFLSKDTRRFLQRIGNFF
ncbi:hypothetical protein [Microseira sp. BLCC-F43]|uniref:hypothetical protein n=1 Tax=Microseira sp. BLCC-F43 TaxID=3153602 RepID=UPI0035B826A9